MNDVPDIFQPFHFRHLTGRCCQGDECKYPAQELVKNATKKLYVLCVTSIDYKDDWIVYCVKCQTNNISVTATTTRQQVPNQQYTGDGYHNKTI